MAIKAKIICASARAVPAAHSAMRHSAQSMCHGRGLACCGMGARESEADSREGWAAWPVTVVWKVRDGSVTGSCSCGRLTERRGSASTAAAAAVQTRWRAADDRPRRSFAISQARASTAVLFSAAAAKNANHTGSYQRNILLALLAGLFDQGCHAVQLVAREFRGRNVEQRGHNLFGGIVEERVHQMLNGGTLGLVARHYGHVDITQAFGQMADVALLFQHAQHGAHGRVAGGIVHSLAHFGGGGLAVAVEDVHDLPLAAAQLVGLAHGRSCEFSSSMLRN